MMETATHLAARSPEMRSGHFETILQKVLFVHVSPIERMASSRGRLIQQRLTTHIYIEVTDSAELSVWIRQLIEIIQLIYIFFLLLSKNRIKYYSGSNIHPALL